MKHAGIYAAVDRLLGHCLLTTDPNEKLWYLRQSVELLEAVTDAEGEDNAATG